MSNEPSCASCGAVMASDQQYCLECGAKRSSVVRPAWRAPLLAATATVLVAAIVLALAYQRLRDDANDDAARSARPAPGLTPAPSAPPAAPAVPTPPPAAPLAPESPDR